MATKTSLLAYAIPILVLSGLVWLISTEIKGPMSSDANSDMEVKIQVPTFNVASLMMPGERMTQTAIHGKVSLLIFWGSWCPACRAEFPMLMNIQKNYQVPMYSMILNDDPNAARALLTQTGNPFVTTGVDVGATVAQTLNVVATPETFLVDKHGMIRFRYIGTITQNAWDTVLLPLVNQYKTET